MRRVCSRLLPRLVGGAGPLACSRRPFQPQGPVTFIGDDKIEDLEAQQSAARKKPLPPLEAWLRRFRLPQDEAVTLTKLLYHEHYRPVDVRSRTGAAVGDELHVDAAGWSHAQAELKWLTEWAVYDFVREAEEDAFLLRDPGSVLIISRKLKLAVLDRVDHHKPLSYIIGNQPFLGALLECRPPLLIPRPETEQMVQWLLKAHVLPAKERGESVKVLDLCCGTGCIGLALAKGNFNVSVVAVDISKAAVQCSFDNANTNGISCEMLGQATPGVEPPQYRVGESDMFVQLPPQEQGTFDLIVSNPPYILPDEYPALPRTVLSWEDKLALVGDDRHAHPMAYYEEIAAEAPRWLKPSARSTMTGNALSSVKAAMLPPAVPSLVLEAGLQVQYVGSMLEKARRARDAPTAVPLPSAECTDPKAYHDVTLHSDMREQPRWVTAALC